MSPSPSQIPASVDPVRKAGHSRHNSTASPVSGDPTRTIKQSAPTVPSVAPKPVHYTCIVRLPFVRHDFEDPPPVQWDSIKDRALWKLISHASNSKELNWEEISIRFNVSLSFLLQQAAWLYERHFEGMKAQMKRLGTASLMTGGTSPVSQTEGGIGSAVGMGGVSMQRTGSKGSRTSMLPPTLQINRDITGPSSVEAAGSPATPRGAAPPFSRTPSSTTVTQSRLVQATAPSRTQPLQRGLRSSSGSERRPPIPAAAAAGTRAPNDPYYEDAVEHEGPFNSDSEEETSALARSRAIRRGPFTKKPLAKAPRMGLVGSDDGDASGPESADDNDSSNSASDSGGYLPFASASARHTKVDPAATLRGTLKKPLEPQASSSSSSSSKPSAATPGIPGSGPAAVAAARNRFRTSKGTGKPAPAPRANVPESPTSSSATSGSAMLRQLSSSGTEGAELVPRPVPPPGPLSPRHRARLASLSPRLRREGSEGSPSMGSSFSDLDDASVSQSALEDALMSNIRQGGNFSSMASRMSSLRDALGR